MSDLLRVDSDYNVFWLGDKLGVLATTIRTDFKYPDHYGPSFDPGRHVAVSFEVYEEPPKPPPAPKRSWSRAMGLRRPK